MKDYTINVHGRLMDLSEPVVMGILNATPDSFYAGSRVQTDTAIAARAHEIIEQGGRIIERGNHEELLQKQGRYHQLYTGATTLS